MKKIIAGALAFLLVLTLTISQAFAITTAEKEENYKTALEELENYMENPGDARYSLLGVIGAFEALNNFQYSRKLLYYAQALQKIEAGEFDIRYRFYIDNIVNDEKFCQYLSDEADYHALGTPIMLKAYGDGRKAELEGEDDAARKFYQSCTGFFDSDTRSEQLYLGSFEELYLQAAELLNQNKLAEACIAFAQCGTYKDSEDLVQFLIKELGYDPTTAAIQSTAAPTAVPRASKAAAPAFDLILLEKTDYVMFRWQIVEGANSYVVKRHGKNDDYSIICLTTGTSYRDSSVYPNYIYYYTVTAQFPDGSEVDSRELSVVAERSAQPATAKPTAVPTARPTAVPTAKPAAPTATPTKVPAQWGAWSAWSTTPVSASSTRQVETEVRNEKTTVTKYNYNRWTYFNTAAGYIYYSYAQYMGSEYKKDSGKWEYKTTDTPLAKNKVIDGVQEYVGHWFNEKQSTQETTKQVTYYRYRDLK